MTIHVSTRSLRLASFIARSKYCNRISAYSTPDVYYEQVLILLVNIDRPYPHRE